MSVKITADEVERGHSLPGLDHGYVVEVESNPAHDTITITFHTADGEEAELTCPAYMPITVDEREPRWVGA